MVLPKPTFSAFDYNNRQGRYRSRQPRLQAFVSGLQGEKDYPRVNRGGSCIAGNGDLDMASVPNDVGYFAYNRFNELYDEPAENMEGLLD